MSAALFLIQFSSTLTWCQCCAQSGQSVYVCVCVFVCVYDRTFVWGTKMTKMNPLSNCSGESQWGSESKQRKEEGTKRRAGLWWWHGYQIKSAVGSKSLCVSCGNSSTNSFLQIRRQGSPGCCMHVSWGNVEMWVLELKKKNSAALWNSWRRLHNSIIKKSWSL